MESEGEELMKIYIAILAVLTTHTKMGSIGRVASILTCVIHYTYTYPISSFAAQGYAYPLGYPG